VSTAARGGSIAGVAAIFRNPTSMTFVDADNHELLHITDVAIVPRVGENVRLGRVPYIVERIGYDIPDKSIERIWVVCRPA
jgi:hypothetical protein